MASEVATSVWRQVWEPETRLCDKWGTVGEGTKAEDDRPEGQ